MVLCVLFPVLTYHTPPGAQFSFGDFIAYSFVAMAEMALLFATLQIMGQVILLFTARNRGVIGEHVIEIRDDGLMEKTSFNESLHRWNGLHKIIVSRAAISIYVTEYTAHYIPFRAFPSKEEAMRFEAELRRRVKAAQGN